MNDFHVFVWGPHYVTLGFFRGCGEKLQAWGRGQDPEYHHGYEGAHEDKREEPS